MRLSARPRILAVAALLACIPPASVALADGVPPLPWIHAGQTRPALVADGAGGAWLAFKTDTYANGLARLRGDGRGDPGWPLGLFTTGMLVQLSSPTRLLANSADRVLILSDQCSYERLVMAYGADGDTAAGFPVSTELFFNTPGSVLGSDGRVLTAVLAAFGGAQSGLRYAIHSALGAVIDEGEVVMDYQVIAGELQVVPDGADGMILGVPMHFAPDYSTGTDVAIQRLAADGSRPWGVNGLVLCNTGGNQADIRVASDGAGGALVTWTDPRTTPAASPLDVYAARVTPAGTLAPGWTAQGKRVASATGAQFDSRVADDGAGGAWILWRDQRVTDIDLYFTRVLGNGAFAPGFTSMGTLLCGAAGTPTEPRLVADGAGGFFAVWIDPRDGEADLYGTHVTSAGVPAPGWPADGLALCADPAIQSQPALAATGLLAAIVAWKDARVPGGQVFALALGDAGPNTADVGDPPAAGLRLRAAANPVTGPPEVWLSAPSEGRVEVGLFDLAGRCVRRTVVQAGATETRVRFAGGPLAAGVYFARAGQGARSAVARLCVLR